MFKKCGIHRIRARNGRTAPAFNIPDRCLKSFRGTKEFADALLEYPRKEVLVCRLDAWRGMAPRTVFKFGRKI